MSKLQLSIAVGNYDRMRPLIDGEVQIDGVDPVFMLQDPEEIFSVPSATQTTTFASFRSAAIRSKRPQAPRRTSPCPFSHRARSATARSMCVRIGASTGRKT